MTVSPSTADLRSLSLQELQREIGSKRTLLQKMRLTVQLRREKDTARYRRERRTIARMLMILREKERKASLLARSRPSTVPAS